MRRLAPLLTKGRGGAGNGMGISATKIGADCNANAGLPANTGGCTRSKREEGLEDEQSEIGPTMPGFPARLRGAKEIDLQ
ncbi:uncharacterized protein P174DRAFT_420598 [Aspergillus novofumigatus IBT 16806]|uniref:Uncharacterized protein n=1 Tax=Aspergillus novofumigatus (strain IBT 16806) TaxID=1392255 RepID=A0A2I1C8W6_ASPN1|nr:uncharacterized protein P174DRAFT_420598 [Aspergillus novofumigatus IBT 16806]PKX94035.1 hypothetical protein P174DRAFT_420598 [Aspergillus novofumigatus IBT 16806]